MNPDKITIQLLKEYESRINNEIEEYEDDDGEWEESLEDLQNTKWKINDSIRYLEGSIKFCEKFAKEVEENCLFNNLKEVKTN